MTVDGELEKEEYIYTISLCMGIFRITSLFSLCIMRRLLVDIIVKKGSCWNAILLTIYFNLMYDIDRNSRRIDIYGRCYDEANFKYQ